MQRARFSRGLAGGWHGRRRPGVRLALVYELLMWSARGGSEPLAIGAHAMALASGYLTISLGVRWTTARLAIGRRKPTRRQLLSTSAQRPTALNKRELYRLPGWHWLRDNEAIHSSHLLADAGSKRRPGTAGRGRPAATGECRRVCGRYSREPLVAETAEIDGDGARECARKAVHNVQNVRSRGGLAILNI